MVNMAAFLPLVFLGLGIGSALLGIVLIKPDEVYKYLVPLPPKREIFPFEYRVWAASGKATKDVSIRPFKVAVSDLELADLKRRLANTRYGAEMVDINFTYGFPSDELKKVVDYWLTKYDWPTQEKMLNQYPQYLTAIEGLDIHFVHVKPQEKDKTITTYPIAMFHGWPGSFFELYKLIPLLTKPRSIAGQESVAYELVIPAIPGFGYSQAAEVKGMDPCNIARIFDKLMERLGHEQYYIYGGDWGTAVARCLSLMYPERILGMDVTLYSVPKLPGFLKGLVAQVAPSLVMDPAEVGKLFSLNTVYTMLRELGFTHIQSTKPETVGAGISDSPAGLAAYILALFSAFTRPEFEYRKDGGLTEHFTMDDLLTNVMIYWITNSIQSSMRIYKENCGYTGCGNTGERYRYPVTVPTVLSDFAHEMAGANPPSDFVKPYFTKLIKVSSHPEGGHFSAMEKPVELADDIWTVLTAVLEGKV